MRVRTTLDCVAAAASSATLRDSIVGSGAVVVLQDLPMPAMRRSRSAAPLVLIVGDAVASLRGAFGGG